MKLESFELSSVGPVSLLLETETDGVFRREVRDPGDDLSDLPTDVFFLSTDLEARRYVRSKPRGDAVAGRTAIDIIQEYWTPELVANLRMLRERRPGAHELTPSLEDDAHGR